MTALTKQQVCGYAQQAGFTGAALDEAVAIAQAESGFDTSHINNNPNGSTATVNGKQVQVPPNTKDYGLMQINTWWNPSVSVAQAQDPAFAMKWAYNVTGGKQPTASSDPFRAYWVTVQNGAYKKYLQTNTCGSGSTSGGSTSGGSSSATDALLGGISAGAGSVLTGTTGASIGDLITYIQSTVSTVTGAIPDLLIHIGLFVVGVALLIAGFLLVANSNPPGVQA